MTRPWSLLTMLLTALPQTLALMIINARRCTSLFRPFALALVVMLGLGINTVANAQIHSIDSSHHLLTSKQNHPRAHPAVTDCHQHTADTSTHGQQHGTTVHCCAFLCGGTAAIQLVLPHDPRVLTTTQASTLPDYLSSATYYQTKPPQRPPRLV